MWKFLGGCFSCDAPQRVNGHRGRANPRDGNFGSFNKRFSEIDRDRKESFTVELCRENGEALGLVLSGGSDKQCCPKISCLKPDSVAHRCDALTVGDHVVTINGIHINKLRHDEILALLNNAGDRAVLEVQYDLPVVPETQNPMLVCPRVIQVNLERDSGSFGLTLRTALSLDVARSKPLIVTQIRGGSPADRDGTIRTGDRVLAIDNINITSASLQEALDVLQHAGSSALFTVEYDISVLDTVHNATGSLLVELDKVHGSKLGITLGHTYRPEEVLVVESIKQASIAERCGALHVGDQVLAIGDKYVEHMSAAEAMQILRSCSEEDGLKLEIFPLSHLLQKRVPYAKRSGFNQAPMLNTVTTYGTMQNRFCVRSSASSPHLSSSNYHQHGLKTIPEVQEKGMLHREMTTSTSCYSSFPSAATSSPGVRSQVCHTEITEVTVQADLRGFGFSLQGTTDVSGFPVINSLDPNGPAEKKDTLQVGDRVLAVNGKNVQGMSGDELAMLLQRSRPQVTLEVEFDVAESVVPSSGTFAVKLPKRGGCLGITVTSPKNRQQGEPLLISSIKKGSVAHRTGTIQPGDKLLAINSIRMDACTVDDAAQILLECGEIVKLRIRKDDVFSEEPDVTGSVVYTVELVRHGEPLGITLSGSEEPFDPIIISGLTEGGIAEKTGAIHVGDRLLAINGHSLRGKPLSEAILLLQNSRDTVTLKISKSPEGDLDKIEKDLELHHDYLRSLTRPLPSVDSAVESWDSSKVDMSPCLPRGGQRKTKRDQNEILNSGSRTSEDRTANVDSMSNATILEESSWEIESSLSETGTSKFSPCDKETTWNKYDDQMESSWLKSPVSEGEETGSPPVLNRNCDSEVSGPYLCEKDLADFNSAVYHLNEHLSHIKSCSRSDDNVSEINSQFGRLSDIELPCTSATNDHRCNTLPYTSRRCKERQPFGTMDSISPDKPQSPGQPYPLPIPIEVHQVYLFKDNVYEDFGFSVSDGLYYKGVYINRIRPGGPADASGLLQPLDRILQVNETKTEDFDCCLTVPLIAAAGDKVHLIISRPAYMNGTTNNCTATMRTSLGLSPWMEEEDQEECSSPQPPEDLLERITKDI